MIHTGTDGRQRSIASVISARFFAAYLPVPLPSEETNCAYWVRLARALPVSRPGATACAHARSAASCSTSIRICRSMSR